MSDFQLREPTLHIDPVVPPPTFVPPLHVPQPAPLVLPPTSPPAGPPSAADILRAVGHWTDLHEPAPSPTADVARSMTPANNGGNPHPRVDRGPSTPAGTSVGLGGNGVQLTLPALGASVSLGPAAEPPAVSEPEGQVRAAARDAATPEPPANVPDAPEAPLTPILQNAARNAAENIPRAIRPHPAR